MMHYSMLVANMVNGSELGNLQKFKFSINVIYDLVQRQFITNIHRSIDRDECSIIFTRACIHCKQSTASALIFMNAMQKLNNIAPLCFLLYQKWLILNITKLHLRLSIYVTSLRLALHASVLQRLQN